MEVIAPQAVQMLIPGVGLRIPNKINTPSYRPCPYTIESKLGKGIFGEVLLARNDITGQQVALKKIPKYSKKFDVKKIRNEIDAGKKLKHDDIIEFIDFFETEQNIYLVLEYFPGSVDLYTLLESRDMKPLREKDAKPIFRQLVSALAYSHSQGISHRDIKLDNILIDRKARIKVIDWGLCTHLQSMTDKSTQFVGSPAYCCPEIYRREAYNPFKADVWSAGVVLYALLVGYFPFSQHEQESGQQREVCFSYSNSNLSLEAQDLIRSMLAHNPEERPTMEEVLLHPWFSS